MNLAAGFWHFACHFPSDLTSRDEDSNTCADPQVPRDLLRGGERNVRLGM